jgi:hypothetical protein
MAVSDNARRLAPDSSTGLLRASRAAVFVVALTLPIMGACSRPAAESTPVASTPRARSAATAPASMSRPVAASSAVSNSASVALPTVLVHKSPTCGCCTGWVEHMRKAGFTVQVDEQEDLEPLKKRLGVPAGKGSCHTAEVGGLVVEGHVPAEDIKRLLADRGNARGLVVPGMPMGSPGMEVPDGRVQPYTVERINADGSTSPFARHGE